MIIRHDQLSLQTITISDVELLRKWRNDKKVNKYLLNNDFITSENQLKWFQSLDPSTSIYFLIKENTIPIGLVYANNINKVGLSFEGSIFIGEIAYYNSFAPIKAAILLSFFFFEYLHFNSAYSIVHEQNKSALELDARFGYKEIGRSNEFIKSKCMKEDYLKYSGSFKNILFRNEQPEFLFEDTDIRFQFFKILDN